MKRRFAFIMIRSGRNRLLGLLALLGMLAAASGCSTGPRMVWLTSERYPPRPSIYPIEVFAGRVQRPHREIALIESVAYDIDDVYTREAQLEQLQEKARELGADAVDNVRILAKLVKGYTIDERAPAPAVKQGQYPLFFMRGRAIIYEASLDLVAPGESPGQAGPEDIPREDTPSGPEGLAPLGH
jgi:hypothetical protein